MNSMSSPKSESREKSAASGKHKPVPGARPPELGELVRCEDRISFVYFEHCIINRKDNAITVTDNTGTIYVPAASLSVLMLGPGTNVTHQAMTVIGENGATVIWVGERGVRMYAFGKPLTHSSTLLQQQARLVSNNQKRLAVAREMYQMRFPGEDVSRLTMQQLRGREGARIRKVYRILSKETGVEWDKRTYNPQDYDDSNDINKALSAAHTCLYGIAHSVIVALGCSPGLGGKGTALGAVDGLAVFSHPCPYFSEAVESCGRKSSAWLRPDVEEKIGAKSGGLYKIAYQRIRVLVILVHDLVSPHAVHCVACFQRQPADVLK